MPTMKAAVVRELGKPLSIEEMPKPEPGLGQVVVKIESCGLCHTDIHAARGDWPVKPKLPLIPGHEGVGIVESVGAGVTEVKEGDRVALPWLGYNCCSCEYCISGWETLCQSQERMGYSIDGSYAQYALAFARNVVKVPKGVDPFEASPLTCAGVTSYKAVKVSGARASDLVAIFGVGGLGHLAVQYAKIIGASVVAVDLSAEKLALAQELGADYVVNASEEDPVTAIQRLGGADASLPFAATPKVFEQAFRSLRPGGRSVLVALPAENRMELPIFETVLNGLHVIGSIVGTRLDLAETFELHALGKTKVEYERRRLEAVNESFAAVESGQVKARLVFDLT